MSFDVTVELAAEAAVKTLRQAFLADVQTSQATAASDISGGATEAVATNAHLARVAALRTALNTAIAAALA